MKKMDINYDDLIGTPFKNHGRGDGGYDCYGLVKEVFKRYGINIPEYDADFDDSEKINSLVRDNTAHRPWKQVDDINHLPVPCLVALRFGSPVGVVNHTGTYIGHGQFIHTRAKVGACIDRIDSIAWKRCIVGFYEYVGY